MSEKLPLPSKAALVQQFVGKSLRDIPLPAVVVDIAAVKRNCKRMSEAVEALDYDFLPLVNVHKVSSTLVVVVLDEHDRIASLANDIGSKLPFSANLFALRYNTLIGSSSKF